MIAPRARRAGAQGGDPAHREGRASGCELHATIPVRPGRCLSVAHALGTWLAQRRSRGRRARMVAGFALAALLALHLAGGAAPAEAHANLVRSEPPANAVVPEAPAVVQLWFSEEPEPRFSEIAIFTTARQRVPAGALQVAPEDRKSLLVKLDTLPPGTYTVAWKALSAVDGHTTAGAFAFAVGVGQSVAGPVSGVVAQVGQTSRPTPLDAALRWLGYLAMAGLLGAVAFVPFVLKPALSGLREELHLSRTPSRRAARPDAGTHGQEDGIGAVSASPTRRVSVSGRGWPWGASGAPAPVGAGDPAGAGLGNGNGEATSAWAAPAAPVAPWIDAVEVAVTGGLRRLAWVAFWLVVATTVAGALVQAARAANLPETVAAELSRADAGSPWLRSRHALHLLLAARLFDPSPEGPLRTLLLETRYGQLWLGRALLLALMAFVLVRLGRLAAPHRSTPTRRMQSPRRGGAGPRVWPAAVVVAALVALTTSLGSHAAAIAPSDAAGAPYLPVFADWIHLVATGVWVGGLFALVLALPLAGAALWAGGPAPQAGGGARTAAGALVIGPHRMVRLLGALVPAFSRVAVVCVAALLLTGFYQALLHVGSWGALFGTAYGQALVVKLALVAPLLLLGAFNLLVARPHLARQARVTGDAPQLVRLFRLAVGGEAVLACGVLLAVSVMTLSQPARDAWAELTRGITLEATAADLRLRLRVNPGTPGFNTYALLVRDARGRPVADAEKVALIASHAEHDMGVSELVLAPQGEGWYQAESALASMSGAWRMEALVRRRGRDDVRLPFDVKLVEPAPSGPAYSGTPVAPAEARLLRNPVPKTDESLAIGRQIYTQNCLVCHGPQGRGDGPAARALRPPPADLAQHVQQHTEGELWWWITNGVPGTAMPAWKDVLSDTDRWHVLNYIVEAFTPATR